MLNKETNLKNKGIPKLYLAGAGVGPGRAIFQQMLRLPCSLGRPGRCNSFQTWCREHVAMQKSSGTCTATTKGLPAEVSRGFSSEGMGCLILQQEPSIDCNLRAAPLVPHGCSTWKGIFTEIYAPASREKYLICSLWY